VLENWNYDYKIFVSKKLKNFSNILSNPKKMTIFAVPKLRRSSPNQLNLRDLGKFEIILKLYSNVTT